MDKLIYDSFYNLHKDHLKEIFYPIKKYLNNNPTKKSPYVFFKEYNIILENKNIPAITNFNNEFYFFIGNDKDIKKIKLYINEKQFYIFWTCSKDFTQYFFVNHLKRRICIKNENNSFKSFNLNESENYKFSEYYLYPLKTISFLDNIQSLLYLDLNNPPKEISFITEKGKYYSKYNLMRISNSSSIFETFFHNRKIGISVSLILDLKAKYNNYCRILYLNMKYLLMKDSKLKKEYLLYFLNFLFRKDEEKKASDFLMEIYYNFNYYHNQYVKLIYKIFDLFKNDEKKIYIIFDDIHSIEEYNLLKNIKKELNDELVLYKKKIFIRDFISINENTLDIIKIFIKDKKNIEILGKSNNEKIKDDLEIIVELMNDKINYIKNYKKKIDDELKIIFFEYNIKNEVKLIKLLYYASIKQLDKNEFQDIIINNDLNPFIKYLYINKNNNIINIEFRNKIIHSLFIDYYTLYYTIFNHSLSEKCIINFLGSEKGFNFERNIIYSILIGKSSKEYDKVDIQRIYCFGKCENFSLDKNILFYQNISNAPKYDFALLIKNNEMEYILKSYQVSILKNINDLNELGYYLITYDLRYFCDKISRIKNIKIKSFSFGIIISYDSYKNNKEKVDIISDFCQNKNYEFLLYDIKEKKLYYNESKNKGEISLKIISSFSQLGNEYLKTHKSVIKQEAKIPQKLYIKNVEDSEYIKNIKNLFQNKYKIDITPKLIAKFNSEISQFEQESDDNLIFYYISKRNKQAYIYYHNYILNENSITIDNSKKNIKTQVLVYQVNKTKKILNIDFSNKKKVQLKLSGNKKEKDNNYLIVEKKEDLYYDEQIENNDDNSVVSDENTYIEENYKSDLSEKVYEIDKENFLGETLVFNYNKGIYLEKEIYNKNEENKSKDIFSDSLISEQIYDEESQDFNKLQNEKLASLDDKYILIGKNVYEGLLNGNINLLDTLLAKLNKDESNKNDKNYLDKKRKCPSKNKEKKK